MKRTVTVNLNGRVFTMDEDAYQLLDKYLNNIRIYFRKEEGSAEIIADFEARIEELFSERIRLGQEVITATNVEEVISRVGKPDDFGDRESENRSREEEKQNFQQSAQQGYQEVKKSFYRDNDQKMLGGVCSGLAAYFDWDVLVVRIIAIILIFGTSGMIIPIYLLAWIIFPAARTATEKLQMQGKPITVENIGKTVAAEAVPVNRSEHGGCLEGFISVIVTLMKIFLIGIGCIIALPLIIALFAVIIAVIASLFGVGGGLLGIIPFGLADNLSFLTFDYPIMASISFIFFIGIPLVVLIYSIVASIAKFKPVEKSVKWILLAVWIISFILILSSGIKINKNSGFSWSGWNNDSTPSDSASLTEQEYVIDQPFDTILMDEGVIGNVKIEQSNILPATIKVSGSEFLVKKIQHEVNNGQLRVSIPNDQKWTPFRFGRKKANLSINISTPGVKSIQSRAIGNVSIPNAFKVDDLNLEIKGVGKFQADSLYVQTLRTSAEGVGSIILSGQARKVYIDMKGTGSIDALGLASDSVYAEVKGIGSVKTNPASYLKGKVEGIGSLTYKEEPKEKNTEMSGIGKIGKE